LNLTYNSNSNLLGRLGRDLIVQVNLERVINRTHHKRNKENIPYILCSVPHDTQVDVIGC
jgi:hypothetical protein